MTMSKGWPIITCATPAKQPEKNSLKDLTRFDCFCWLLIAGPRAYGVILNIILKIDYIMRSCFKFIIKMSVILLYKPLFSDRLHQIINFRQLSSKKVAICQPFQTHNIDFLYDFVSVL